MRHHAPVLTAAAHHAARGLHLSPGVIAVIAIAAVVAILLARDSEGVLVAVTIVGVIGATAYFLATGKPAKTPAPKVVTHVITHVVTRPGKPVLTGTEVTVIICVGLVLGLAYLLTRKGN